MPLPPPRNKALLINGWLRDDGGSQPISTTKVFFFGGVVPLDSHETTPKNQETCPTLLNKCPEPFCLRQSQAQFPNLCGRKMVNLPPLAGSTPPPG